MNRYYSMKEVAVALRVTVAQAYYLKNTGKIKAKKIGAQYVVGSRELNRIKRERNGNGS